MSRVCVFCGSQPGSDRRFVDAATELGRGLALAGHTLVYGGSKSGCMGALADAALADRGTVLGVIPRVLHATELRHDALTETVIVEDLAARKLEMFRRSDTVLVMPGGTGTLDELLEALTMKRIGLLDCPIAVVDIAAYFAPTLELFRQMIVHGFAEPEQLRLFDVLPDVPTALGWIARQ